MTRLDAVIERLKAQRSALGAAAQALSDTPGHILELGLGNGRTYDHLRHLFSDRKIYVFDSLLHFLILAIDMQLHLYDPHEHELKLFQEDHFFYLKQSLDRRR